MSIEFLVCTIDERIFQVQDLLMPPMPGVKYLVSWQHSERKSCTDENSILQASLLESWNKRGDIRLVEIDGRGLSRNRNNALRYATGDFLVIADDDCRYTKDCIQIIHRAFEKHPDAAAIQFQGYTLDGKQQRKYSDYSYEYKERPKFSYVISWELVLNRTAQIPFFDERFGLGTDLCCGEEELFVHKISESGQKIFYEPYKIVTTPEDTTGTHFEDSVSVQRAKGGVLSLMYGSLGATLRCFKFALLYPKVSLSTKISFMTEMFKGIVYVHTHHSVL